MINQSKHFQKLWLSLMIVGLALIWAAGAKAAVQCLPPTPLNPFVNPFTGDVNLNWLAAAPASKFYIDIKLGWHTSCDGGTSVQTYVLDGTMSHYTIPDVDLNGLGQYTFCIRAECCNDRCDNCDGVTPPGENKDWANLDYCAKMAQLYTNPCACTDPLNPSAVPGSFVYKCADPLTGNVVESKIPCYGGFKTVGCNWQCMHFGVAGSTNKACGADYDVKCGQGPNNTIVSSQPKNNLCSVGVAGVYGFNDSFLANPPGVKEASGYDNPLLYSWSCVGAQEQCSACRRAICSPRYNNKMIGSSLAQIFGKAQGGSLNDTGLCNDTDGTLTANVANVVETDAGWTWDCIGRSECGADNKNWLDATHQVPTCQALKADCGWAKDKFLTYDNYTSQQGSRPDFYCLNGGRVQGTILSPDKNASVYNKYKDSQGITHETLDWRCVYDDPAIVAPICHANIIGCNDNLNGKSLTAGSWADQNTGGDVQKALNTYCQNGLNANMLNEQGDYGLIDSTAPNENNLYTWVCKDLWGGSQNCSADYTACQTPPNGGYFKDFADLSAQKLCTGGKSVFYGAGGANESSAWSWLCLDSFGKSEVCSARQLKCQTPPNKGIFNSVADLANAGISCTGQTGNNLTGCTGACNDPAKPVDITFANNKWTWNCGESCSATLLDCAAPPQGYFYGSLDEFSATFNCTQAAANAPLECSGVCTDPTYSAQVSWDKANHKFIWSCGPSKDCFANEGGCGSLNVNPATGIKADDFANKLGQADGLCLNGGVAKWYNAYNQPETGFTPYGNGEFANGTAFADTNTASRSVTPPATGYKEGAWLWYCDYTSKGGKLMPNDLSNQLYYKATAPLNLNPQNYCYNFEIGECAPASSLKGKYTLAQLQVFASDDNQRGNQFDKDGGKRTAPYLCARGTVALIDGTEFSTDAGIYHNGFGKLLDTDKPSTYVYQCSSGMGGGIYTECQVDIISGCAKPPHEGIYNSDNAFTTDYNKKNGCAGGFSSGYNLDQDTCKWNWTCGSDSCFATKVGQWSASGTIKGAASTCSKDKAVYDTSGLTITGCSSATVAWTLTDAQGNTTTGSDNSYTLPDDLPQGDANLSVTISCADVCMDNTIKPFTTSKKIAVSTAKTPSLDPLAANDNGCSDKDGVYSTKVNDCSDYDIIWTLTNSAGTVVNTRSGQSLLSYSRPKNLPAGNYSLKAEMTCNDNCAKPKTVSNSTDITIQASPQATVGTIGANPNPVCSKNDAILTLSAASCTGGATPVIQWFENGQPVGDGKTTLGINKEVLTQTNFDYYATVTCGDDPCKDAAITTHKVITIKPKSDPISGALSVQPTDNTVCSKNDAVITLDDYGCTDGSTPKIAWYENGGKLAGETSAELMVNKTVTKQTKFSYYAEVICGAAPCETKATTTAQIITINPAVIPTVSAITGPANFCSGTATSTYNITIGGCQVHSTTWTLTDTAGNVADSGSGDTAYTPDSNLSAGNYTLTSVVTCADPCASPTQITKTKAIVINQTKHPTLDNIAGAPDFCSATGLERYVTAAGDCAKPTINWTLTKAGAKIDTGLGDSYTAKNLATGNYVLTAVLTCADVCAAPTTVTQVTSFAVHNCGCGTADTNNFVDINNTNPFGLCKSGCTQDTPKLRSDSSGWDWTCTCGSDVADCAAGRTDCGSAANAAGAPTKLYTPNSWKTANTCANGTFGNYQESNASQPSANNSCIDNLIKDTRNWTCKDSANQTVSCTNQILDCGIAEANRVLKGSSSCAIHPQDGSVFAGSYQTSPLTAHLCTISGKASLPSDTGRGKWYWECGADSVGNSLQCEARKDCGWMVRDGSGADSANYATVDYGSAGCWTAEDVGTWTSKNTISMNWGKATRIFTVAGDGACANSPTWWSCKGVHCFSLLTNAGCNQTGICGSNTDSTWTLPSDANWSVLESNLANGNSCDASRFGTADCSPAGNDGSPSSYGNDGLKDLITFGGVAGMGYWSNTQHYRSPTQDANFCTGSTCARALSDRVFDSSDQVIRKGDLGNTISTCTSNGNQSGCPVHNVRCYKPTGSQGGGQSNCVGFGC